MRNNPSDTERINHMLQAIEMMHDITKDETRESFLKSLATKLAVQKLIEITGEAASHISAITKKLQPDIPWVEIINTRHRAIHEYNAVNYDLFWTIVEVELPKLKPLLQALLAEIEKKF